MENYLKRTWAEINLGALEKNYIAIRKTINTDKMMAMIKADAYGHGAVGVARKLSELGVDYFGAATITEAIELRRNGIKTPILIMGYTPVQYTGELVKYDITQSVTDYECAKRFSDAAMVYSKRLKVHVKLDTGMGREGIVCSGRTKAAAEEAYKICTLDGIYAEGIFTHFSDACSNSDEYTMLQSNTFAQTIGILERKGIKFEIKHCANSAAVLKYPCVHFDMVRAGIILYGLKPDDNLPLSDEYEPVMTLKTVISEIKDMDEGFDIGYSRTFTTKRHSKIAVVPIGYADGFLRLCSNNISLMVRGKKAPVVGRVCMDISMIDVTDIPEARRGDTVTVFGSNTNCSVDDIANACLTINYEIVTNIGKRVPRIFLNELE